MVWNFWRMYFKRWIPNSNTQFWIYESTNPELILR
jgi:hypothetical protein